MSENYKNVDDDIHYIDWNPKNNNEENLIVIPRKIRELVHEYLGYVNREELIKLVEVFESSSNYKKKSTTYLNFKLSKYVDTDKDNELAVSCRERLGKLKKPKVKKVNHKKIYETVHGKIKVGWDVHHIDWNHDNNNIDNLIAIPKCIHQLVHKFLGYVTRNEIENLLKIYKESHFPKTASIRYLNHHLRKHVNTKKTSKLARSCTASMHYDILRFHSSFDWKYGKGGLY